MAVREFTDSRGVDWRAWDVMPSHMHPVTRGEDYMANLQDGWLVFECGREKRRLEAPYPRDWSTLPIPELEELCRRAMPVRRVREKSQSGQWQSRRREGGGRFGALPGASGRYASTSVWTAGERRRWCYASPPTTSWSSW